MVVIYYRFGAAPRILAPGDQIRRFESDGVATFVVDLISGKVTFTVVPSRFPLLAGTPCHPASRQSRKADASIEGDLSEVYACAVLGNSDALQGRGKELAILSRLSKGSFRQGFGSGATAVSSWSSFSPSLSP